VSLFGLALSLPVEVVASTAGQQIWSRGAGSLLEPVHGDIAPAVLHSSNMPFASYTKACIKNGVTALRNIIVKTKSIPRALGACRCLTVLKFQACISRLQDSTTQRPISYSLKQDIVLLIFYHIIYTCSYKFSLQVALLVEQKLGSNREVKQEQ
jgi:hypothetical protein